jgi:hypothetical protein
MFIKMPTFADQCNSFMLMNKEIKKPGFAFGRENYRLLIIGVLIIALGYILMVGGGSKDPNEFNADELFSTRRITIAPLTILAGFVTVLWAIMKKTKE